MNLAPETARAEPAWRTEVGRRNTPASAICDFLLLAGWIFEARAGDPGVAEAAEGALNELMAAGLPCRDTAAGPCFDPVEALNFIKLKGLDEATSFWRSRFVETGRRLVREAEAQAACADDRGGRTFRVKLRRVFPLVGFDRTRRTRLRLPLPLARGGASVQVEQISAGGLDPHVDLAGGRMEARGSLPQGSDLTLAAQLIVAIPPRTIPDADDPRLYCEDAAGDRATPRIHALAQRLTTGASHPIERVGRIWRFMLDGLALGAVHYDATPSSAMARVLDTGWYDCQTGSALFVALCRACGIPARQLGGYLLYPQAPTGHFWAEVWLDDRGWCPYDLACWDLSAGGRAPAWRDRFAGRIDARLTTQILPYVFTGASGAPMPRSWHVLPAPLAEGAATALHCSETGRLIFRDEVEITQVSP